MNNKFKQMLRDGRSEREILEDLKAELTSAKKEVQQEQEKEEKIAAAHDKLLAATADYIAVLDLNFTDKEVDVIMKNIEKKLNKIENIKIDFYTSGTPTFDAASYEKTVNILNKLFSDIWLL